ncbi:hypothetical protein NEDG_00510 [Nematocida displodere]|uniref:BRO1 domain-containing protein n=1 Tax=Nematocida displodere TaxID=1805483 RepID=A0A177EJA2_9MICR|nr:hypothetical protein NEDG_00510 [Nematocida displodere]
MILYKRNKHPRQSPELLSLLTICLCVLLHEAQTARSSCASEAYWAALYPTTPATAPTGFQTPPQTILLSGSKKTLLDIAVQIEEYGTRIAPDQPYILASAQKAVEKALFMSKHLLSIWRYPKHIRSPHTTQNINANVYSVAENVTEIKALTALFRVQLATGGEDPAILDEMDLVIEKISNCIRDMRRTICTLKKLGLFHLPPYKRTRPAPHPPSDSLIGKFNHFVETLDEKNARDVESGFIKLLAIRPETCTRKPTATDQPSRPLVSSGFPLHILFSDIFKAIRMARTVFSSYVLFVEQLGISSTNPNPSLAKKMIDFHTKNAEIEANAIIIDQICIFGHIYQLAYHKAILIPEYAQKIRKDSTNIYHDLSSQKLSQYLACAKSLDRQAKILSTAEKETAPELDHITYFLSNASNITKDLLLVRPPQTLPHPLKTASSKIAKESSKRARDAVWAYNHPAKNQPKSKAYTEKVTQIQNDSEEIQSIHKQIKQTIPPLDISRLASIEDTRIERAEILAAHAYHYLERIVRAQEYLEDLDANPE